MVAETVGYRGNRRADERVAERVYPWVASKVFYWAALTVCLKAGQMDGETAGSLVGR